MSETNPSIFEGSPAGSLNVSRETAARLELFVRLLVKWNARMNLVGAREMDRIWERHIADSLQLLKHIPEEASSFIDIGSGAGFPGMVLAIALDGKPDADFSLIESNAKKCAFLREAARITNTRIKVINRRIESFQPGELAADILTARALASVEKLLSFAQPFLGINSLCLFLKGQYVDEELTRASKCWNISSEIHPSQTDPSGKILVIRDIQAKSGN